MTYPHIFYLFISFVLSTDGSEELGINLLVYMNFLDKTSKEKSTIFINGEEKEL